MLACLHMQVAVMRTCQKADKNLLRFTLNSGSLWHKVNIETDTKATNEYICETWSEEASQNPALVCIIYTSL